MSPPTDRPGFVARLFLRGRARDMARPDVGATPGTDEPPLPLTAADGQRIEAEVRRMIDELRAKPTQEKEDRIGLEIATMPAAERDLVTGILLRIVAEESERG